MNRLFFTILLISIFPGIASAEKRMMNSDPTPTAKPEHVMSNSNPNPTKAPKHMMRNSNPNASVFSERPVSNQVPIDIQNLDKNFGSLKN